jgi:hypothetical protein
MTEIERSWADKPRTRSFPTTTERTTTMKHFTKARTLTVAVATGSAVVLAGGVAYAVWTTTGTGAGTAKAATLVAPTVTAGAAPAGQLYPGLTANGTTAGGDLVVSTSNPNAFPITVTVTGGTFTGVGCTTSGVSIGSTASYSLAASAPTATITMSKVLSMSTASTNDCQGATITAASLVTTSTTP